MKEEDRREDAEGPGREAGARKCANNPVLFDPIRPDPTKSGLGRMGQTMAYKIMILYSMIQCPSPVVGNSPAGTKDVSKRTQMMVASETGKHRFSAGMRTFRSVLGSV